MKRLIEKLDTQGNMSCDLKLELLYLFERRQIKKGECLVEEGRIPKYLYFVEDGLIERAYWKDGKRKYTCFWLPGAIIYDYRHLRKQTAVSEHVFAHRESVLFQLSMTRIRDLLTKFPSFQEYLQDLVDTQSSEIEEHKNILRGRFPEKKYEMFLRYYGDNANCIPIEHIADFLCISESILYQVRKNSCH